MTARQVRRAGRKKLKLGVRLETYGSGACSPLWPRCGVCKGNLVIDLGAENTWTWKCPACGVGREPQFFVRPPRRGKVTTARRPYEIELETQPPNSKAESTERRLSAS